MGNTLTRFEEYLDVVLGLLEEEKEQNRQEREAVEDEIRVLWAKVMVMKVEVGRFSLEVFEGWFARWRGRVL